MNAIRIEDLNLHDSVIKDIRIIRSGRNFDTINFYLQYIENYDSMKISDKILSFTNCYKLVADMNFGCMPPDSILTGETIKNSELLATTKDKLKDILKDGQLLQHYRIQTSTTNSIIDIIAEKVELPKTT